MRHPALRLLLASSFLALAAPASAKDECAKSDECSEQNAKEQKSDEALAELWAEYQQGTPNPNYYELISDLAAFGGERLKPLVLQKFTECRNSDDRAECDDISRLLSALGPTFPDWSMEALVDVSQNGKSIRARNWAEDQLVSHGHNVGLAKRQPELAAVRTSDVLAGEHFYLRSDIRDIASYGHAARASASDIARFITPKFDDELREMAALALGKVGDPAFVPTLMALESEFRDNWRIAYDASESLGRLGDKQAVPMLKKLSDEHWHIGVRNIAQRSVNLLSGREFERPGIEGDGRAYEAPKDERRKFYLNFGALRWAGDDANYWCGTREQGRDFKQSPVEQIRWPENGADRLKFKPFESKYTYDISERINREIAVGLSTTILPIPSGQIIGFNGGEFGGGIVFLPDQGEAITLSREPVFGAWQMDEKLYVASGLSHMVRDSGHLYVVDLKGPSIERVIRLPASPTGLIASQDRMMIIETHAGDLAITEDGTLMDPGLLANCD